MCQKCVRASKNNRPKIRYGLVKVMTHYRDIPLFKDFGSNIAIEAHLHKVRQAKTKRRYVRKKKGYFM